MDDEAIRALVARLSRRHPSGGEVIERAAILASGADSVAVEAWIIAHEGQPEAAVTTVAKHGLHGSRVAGNAASAGPPVRYVLPVHAVS